MMASGTASTTTTTVRWAPPTPSTSSEETVPQTTSDSSDSALFSSIFRGKFSAGMSLLVQAPQRIANQRWRKWPERGKARSNSEGDRDGEQMKSMERTPSNGPVTAAARVRNITFMRGCWKLPDKVCYTALKPHWPTLT